MSVQKLFDEILPILYTVKEDPVKLQRILQFLRDEIYEEPEAKDSMEGSETYLNVISEIAGNIDAGFISFLNKDTLEVEHVPKEMLMDPEEYELMTGFRLEEADLKYPGWENVMTFEPLESPESFKIMRKFINQLEDKKLQARLDNALNNRKPFANFKFLIDNSEHRQEWFDFKMHCLKIHVKELLSMEFNQIDLSFEQPEQN